jgi:membrane protease YdiL (CAAX protease family)
MRLPSRPVHHQRSADRAVTLCVFVLFAAIPVARGIESIAVTVLLTACAALACWWDLRAAAQIGIVAAIASLLFNVGLGFPPLVFASAIAVFLALQRLGARPLRRPGWLVAGRVDRGTLVLALCSTLAAAIGLAFWHALAKPDTTAIYATFGFTALPLPALLAGAVLFSAANGAAEELIYRGFLMQSLLEVVGYLPALVLQAAAFGLLHMEGFPSGWAGVGLAAVYGVFMGLVRTRAKGMLAPWMAHVLTDLAIFGILLSALKR